MTAQPAFPPKRWTEVLCTRCGGNGVVKITGGTSVCDHCEGRCYEPDSPSPMTPDALLTEAREWLMLITKGEWGEGHIGNANIVAFDGDDVRPVAQADRPSDRAFIRAAPRLIRALLARCAQGEQETEIATQNAHAILDMKCRSDARAEALEAALAEVRQELADAKEMIRMGHARLDETRAKGEPGDLYRRISWMIELLTNEKAEVQHLLTATAHEQDALRARAGAAEHRCAAAEYRAQRIVLDADLQAQLTAATAQREALLTAAKAVLAQFEAINRHQHELLVHRQTLESASRNWDEATLGQFIDFQPLINATATVEVALLAETPQPENLPQTGAMG